MPAEENNSLVPQPIESTELNANAEYKGNKEDEEDVLLTAQRYLNIFHQIHIFKEFRQKQFRQQLLEIPHEIRRVIALLPGGRVLLEHIAELMQEKGQQDPELDSLLLSLEQTNHFSDNKISAANPNAQTLSMPSGGVPTVVPQVAVAPLELSSDFTHALTESFQTYSQNLKDLSVNIQKMAMNAPRGNTSSEQAALSNEYAEALTASFQAYSQDLKDLTSSIQLIAQNHQNQQAALPASIELGGDVAKNLTASFDTYARNLQELTESIKKIAANQPQVASISAPASVELGGDFSKAFTASFETYSHNLENLTESIKQIAANQQQAPLAAAPTSIELGGDFSKALTASFEAYSHNLENLTESIKQIAANNTAQISGSSKETLLPDFTDSIASVLKENAQQQMDVLKSFGEMLSKTIADSQKELVSSIKKSNQNSVILGKFMQVPAEEISSDSLNTATYTQEPSRNAGPSSTEPAPINLLSAADTENVSNSSVDFDDISPEVTLKAPVTASKRAVKENKNPQNTAEKENKQKQNQEPKKHADKNNSPKTKPEEKAKAQPQESPKTKNKAPQTNVKIEDLVNSADNAPNEIDIDDVFAQVAASLQSDTPSVSAKTDSAPNLSADFMQTEDTSLSDAAQSDTLAQDFADNNTDLQPSQDNKKDKDIERKSSLQNTAEIDPMLQIKNALDSDTAIALDDFDDSPISLSPTDDLQSAFTDTVSASENDDWHYSDTENNITNAADIAADKANTEDSWEYVDENDNPIEPSDDEDWEYEYVDEDGNPISSADEDVEYEYVDEDGNPVELSDDDVEYEYVDEDGNPIEPSDDEDWEYEYVDENGNPIKG